MRGTKWFCIILGCFLLVFTFEPAPFGLVLESTAWIGVSQKMQELFKDGSLSVDVQQLEAKHGSDKGGPGAEHHYQSTEDAQWGATRMVGQNVRDGISGLGVSVGVGKFVMGLLWISVGIRIPAKLPTAPAPPT